MSNTLEEFQFLVSDTLEYITSEHSKAQTLIVTAESFHFFDSIKKTLTPAQLPQPAPLAIKAPIVKTLQEPPAPPSKVKPLSQDKPEIIAHIAKTTAAPTTEFSEEIKKQVQKVLTSVTVVRDVPSDEEATLLSESWKQPTKYASVLIFSFAENAESEKFLYNVKKAIEAHFCSCAIIEIKPWEEKSEWDAFFTIHKPKLILGSPEVFKTKHLLTYFKENTSSKERFLHTHPFMLLYPLSSYLKQPEQKKVLWNNLCKILQINP